MIPVVVVGGEELLSPCMVRAHEILKRPILLF